LPISEELRQNFLVVRDYKRCLSIFGGLGRLNAQACVVFGDFIVRKGIGQDKIPSFRMRLAPRKKADGNHHHFASL
jgi:hypothetical protein